MDNAEPPPPGEGDQEPPPPGEGDQSPGESLDFVGHKPSNDKQTFDECRPFDSYQSSDTHQSIDQDIKANANEHNSSFDGKGPVGFAAAFQQIIHSVGPSPNRFPGPFGISRPPGVEGLNKPPYPGTMPPPFRPVDPSSFNPSADNLTKSNDPNGMDELRSVSDEQKHFGDNRNSSEHEDSSLSQINQKKSGSLPSLLDIEVKLPPPVKNEEDLDGSKDGPNRKGNIDYTPSLRTSVTFGPQNTSAFGAGSLNKPYGFEKRLPSSFSRPPRPLWASRPNFVQPGYNPTNSGVFPTQGYRYNTPPNYPAVGQGYNGNPSQNVPVNPVAYNDHNNVRYGSLKRRSFDSNGQDNETPAKKWSSYGNSDLYSVKDENSSYERVRKAVTPLWNLPINVQLEKKDGAFLEFLGHLKSSLISTNQALSVWFEHQEYKSYNNKLYVESKQILASPVTYGYRNKCDFVIGFDPETKKTRVGLLIEQGSSFVGPVGHLYHISEEMKCVAVELEKYCQSSEILPFDLTSGKGHWMGATVRQSKFSELMLNISFNPQELTKLQLKSVKEKLETYFMSGPGQQCRISSLFFTTRKQWESGETENIFGDSSITEEICGKRFQISPRTFFSVNSSAAELMYNTISGMVHLNMGCTLIDICCGTGSIGLSLSDRCGQVLGIDILEDAVNDANKNALSNNITNCEFMTGSVEDSLPNLWRRVTFSEAICIVDPPRAGIGSKAIQSIRKNSSVTKIVYIASDPYSSVKNFLDFARPPSNTFKGEPFVPVRAIPVDLFPHTSNFCIVFLFMRVKMADLLSPENVDVNSYLRGISDTTNSQIIPEHSGASGPPPDLTWKKVQSAGSDDRTLDQSQESLSTELSEEQIQWLDQMVDHYGPAFEREQWIESFKAQNAEARANYLASLDQSQSHPTGESKNDESNAASSYNRTEDTINDKSKGKY